MKKRWVCLTHERFSNTDDPCKGLGGIAMPCEVVEKGEVRTALAEAMKDESRRDRWRFTVYGTRGDVDRFLDAVRSFAREFVTEDSMGYEVFAAGERSGSRGGSL